MQLILGGKSMVFPLFELLFVIAVGSAAFFSYKRGMLYGGEVTISALEDAGIIEIVSNGNTKTIVSSKKG